MSTCTPASRTGSGSPARAVAPAARLDPKIDAKLPGDRPGAYEAAFTTPPEATAGRPSASAVTGATPGAPSSVAVSSFDAPGPGVQTKRTRPLSSVTAEAGVSVPPALTVAPTVRP